MSSDSRLQGSANSETAACWLWPVLYRRRGRVACESLALKDHQAPPLPLNRRQPNLQLPPPPKSGWFGRNHQLNGTQKKK